MTSHNVFVEINKRGNKIFDVKVKISDLENMDFMDYANQFFDYRISSVWSPPEILKSYKRMPEDYHFIDVYSFGMILWELWHEAIPFDNDMVEAQKYVVNEESRPKIIRSSKDLDSDDEHKEEHLDKSNHKIEKVNQGETG